MKLRNIIPALLASVALCFVGCSDDETPTLLDEVQVSSSYISLPMDGGDNTFTVTAKGDWTLEKVMTKKDSVKWLTISQESGTAGESVVKLTAPKTLDGRTAELLLTCNGKTQHINVIQGLATVSSATCAEVIAGPDSKTYQVTGTVTAIANTTYGNWYLTDKTGTIYIYGTLDAKGAEKNFASLGLEVGDEVTVQGPKTTYGTTVELVNVTVVKINKSLIKVDSVETAELPLEGGVATAYLTCKGQGVSVDIPEDAQSWLSIQSIQQSGTSAVVKFKAAANAGGDRKTTLTFHTTDGSKDYTSQTTLSQAGAILAVTVADFNAAAVSETQYRLNGVVTNVVDAAKGRFYIKDHTGETYVYNLNVGGKTVKVGDIVTVVGKRGEYKGVAQLVNGTLESLTAVSTISISDFRNLPDDKTAYYLISGTVGAPTESGTKYDLVQYGNFNLTDATGSVYIYGVTEGWNGAKGTFGNLGVKEGDTLTILAYKTSYKGLVEAVGVYLSHKAN